VEYAFPDTKVSVNENVNENRLPLQNQAKPSEIRPKTYQRLVARGMSTGQIGLVIIALIIGISLSLVALFLCRRFG
jgi:hypothetical protein